MKSGKSNTTKNSSRTTTIAPSDARFTIRLEGWGNVEWTRKDGRHTDKIEAFGCKKTIIRVTLPYLTVDEVRPLIRQTWKKKTPKGLEKVAFLYDWDGELIMRWTNSKKYKKYNGKNINDLDRAKNKAEEL